MKSTAVLTVASKPEKARQRGDRTRRGAKGASGRRFGMGMFGIPMRSCKLCHCTFSPLREEQKLCRKCLESDSRHAMVDHLAESY